MANGRDHELPILKAYKLFVFPGRMAGRPVPRACSFLTVSPCFFTKSPRRADALPRFACEQPPVASPVSVARAGGEGGRRPRRPRIYSAAYSNLTAKASAPPGSSWRARSLSLADFCLVSSDTAAEATKTWHGWVRATAPSSRRSWSGTRLGCASISSWPVLIGPLPYLCPYRTSLALSLPRWNGRSLNRHPPAIMELQHQRRHQRGKFRS